MTVKKKKNFSPLYVFNGIEELLNNLGKMQDYEYIFVNRYFSKATSWLGKFEPDLKREYFLEYSKLLFPPKLNSISLSLKSFRFISYSSFL